MARKKRQQEETVETPETEDVEEEVTEEVEEPKLATPPKLTSRDDLIKRRYKNGTVTTSLERTFTIKSIDPKALLITRGSAFLPAFSDFLEDPSPESLQNPDLIDFVQKVVLLSVTSVKLVEKELEECSEDEVPIEVIDVDEQIEIFSAVMDLCSTEDEKREWSFFRSSTEEESTSD